MSAAVWTAHVLLALPNMRWFLNNVFHVRLLTKTADSANLTVFQFVRNVPQVFIWRIKCAKHVIFSVKLVFRPTNVLLVLVGTFWSLPMVNPLGNVRNALLNAKNALICHLSAIPATRTLLWLELGGAEEKKRSKWKLSWKWRSVNSPHHHPFSERASLSWSARLWNQWVIILCLTQ